MPNMSLEHNKIKGVTFILASSIVYSGMACLIKVSAELGSYRMAFGRFLIGLLFMSSLWASGRIKMRFNNKPLLVARGVVGCTAIFLTIFAIVTLGIGKGTVILYSYPVYASLFGVLFLKEKLRPVNFIALGVALFGLYLLVVKAGAFENGFGIGKYEMLAVFGSIMAGLAVTIIRKLHETETTFEIFYAQCVFGTLLMIGPAFASGGAIDSRALLVILAIGACAIVGQLLMTEGFRFLPVKTASVLAMSELITNYAMAILIFHEALSGRALIGACLIGTGCVLAVSAKKTVKKA